MPELAFVFHYSMPSSAEAYYDDISRAARDDAAVRCVLFAPLAGERVAPGLTGRRRANDGDIRRVYDALEVLGDSGRAVPIVDLKAAAANIDPVAVRGALDVLKDAGVVKQQRGAQVRVAQRGLSEAALAAVADQHRVRQALDDDKLGRMLTYVTTQGCRWKALLDCLDETAERERCGRCDNCRGWREAVGRPRSERDQAADNG
jgi:ATP-dependent DNA helicase RecQ